MDATLKPILTHLKQDLTELYGDRLLQLTLFIKKIGKAISDLSLHYDVVISCLFMDEIHYRTRNGSLLRNIRKEGVLL